MNDHICICCGSQLKEIDPHSGLCYECAEDMGIDDDYYDDFEDDEDEDYEEVAGSCDECGCDIDSNEAIDGLCDQCSWWASQP